MPVLDERRPLYAAKRGDVGAQLRLAADLACGDGVKKNEVEAARWYTAAAEQGSGDAAYNLATMYQRGEGVPGSRRKALAWFKNAEKLGSGDASVALGTLALDASGSAAPRVLDAVRHFARAALNRDMRGLFLIARTVVQYPDVTREQLISELLRASAEAGYLDAGQLLRSLARQPRSRSARG